MARGFLPDHLAAGLRQTVADLASPWRRLPDLSLAMGGSEVSRKIARAQFRTLMNQPLSSALEPLVGLSLWLAAIWVLTPGRMAFLWSFMMGIPIAIQVWDSQRYLKTMPPDDALRPFEVRKGICSCWCGISWGGLGFAFPGLVAAYAPYMVIGQLLFIAGALGASAPYRPGIPWIALPCTVLNCLYLAQAGGFLNIVITIGLVFGVGMIIRTTKEQNALLTQTMLAAEERVLLLAELERQRAAAQEATEAKTRFLASISHDLRQPMHSIALLTSAFRQQQSDPRGGVAQQIGATVQAMDDMLGALAEVSRLDDGAVPLQIGSVSVGALFGRIEMQFAAQAQHKGLQLQVRTTHVRVVSDAYHLQRMLANLVSNAIRYTPHGRIAVRCRVRGGVAWLQVWDSGLGIERADRQRIFREFVQVKKNTLGAAGEGLGLGLSIVRRAAERLHHPVVLRSRPGRGSLFAVGVPLDTSLQLAGQAAGAGPGLGELLGGQLVLLVDDDPLVLQSMQALLKAFGCHVLAAHSTASALAAVEASLRTPDIIVSDFRLGGVDTGVAAIAQVREATGEPTPALLVSAETGAARIAAQPLGVPVLAKPLQADALAAGLRRVLGPSTRP